MENFKTRIDGIFDLNYLREEARIIMRIILDSPDDTRCLDKRLEYILNRVNILTSKINKNDTISTTERV